ncbi:hypothetical protein BJX65DRAFT_301201 [Aspergillus insuetus]
MVAEDSKRPHSDEAIIKALKHFQVEILDWQKLDLCPAVLQERPLGSAKYIEERVREFKVRLNAARKGHETIAVEHHTFDGPTRTGLMGKSKTGTRRLEQGLKAETMNEHLWLTIMDRFVQAIKKLEADKPPD